MMLSYVPAKALELEMAARASISLRCISARTKRYRCSAKAEPILRR